ncbi:glutathione S-transferase family protein [Zhongshania sp.]|uniref:glutathione S-transferase family protein n=1 Tax=Zhongshania sp. TaxID=1971902 RepID=UPI00356A560C
MPKLLIFPHSHFCEKARWALDYKGISYDPVAVMPGLHLKTIRKIAPGTSVPVLVYEDGLVIQGSSEIIDQIDSIYPNRQLSPVTVEGRQACTDIETEMDEKLGVNIRRILYSTLLDYPAFIRQCFTHSMPVYKKLAYGMIASKLNKRIYDVYVISPAKVTEAKKAFDVAMDQMAKRIEQSPYLVGEQFSRADLSVAAMLSLLTQPAEHPFPWGDIPDAKAQAFCDHYREHPVSLWVNKMYQQYR